MGQKRENLERKALKRFEQVAEKYGYRVFSGQGSENRIPLEGNTYFQFGDLRVETETFHVVIEAESAGGITNLAKYWYCLENRPDVIDKPIALLHIFRQSSEADYGSHLVLWQFLWSQMKEALGGGIKAGCYTYRNIEDIAPAVNEFERHLVKKGRGVRLQY